MLRRPYILPPVAEGAKATLIRGMCSFVSHEDYDVGGERGYQKPRKLEGSFHRLRHDPASRKGFAESGRETQGARKPKVKVASHIIH